MLGGGYAAHDPGGDVAVEQEPLLGGADLKQQVRRAGGVPPATKKEDSLLRRVPVQCDDSGSTLRPRLNRLQLDPKPISEVHVRRARVDRVLHANRIELSRE